MWYFLWAVNDRIKSYYLNDPLSRDVVRRTRRGEVAAGSTSSVCAGRMGSVMTMIVMGGGGGEEEEVGCLPDEGRRLLLGLPQLHLLGIDIWTKHFCICDFIIFNPLFIYTMISYLIQSKLVLPRSNTEGKKIFPYMEHFVIYKILFEFLLIF